MGASNYAFGLETSFVLMFVSASIASLDFLQAFFHYFKTVDEPHWAYNTIALSFIPSIFGSFFGIVARMPGLTILLKI